jgi:hypothetical protein
MERITTLTALATFCWVMLVPVAGAARSPKTVDYVMAFALPLRNLQVSVC